MSSKLKSVVLFLLSLSLSFSIGIGEDPVRAPVAGRLPTASVTGGAQLLARSAGAVQIAAESAADRIGYSLQEGVDLVEDGVGLVVDGAGRAVQLTAGSAGSVIMNSAFRPLGSFCDLPMQPSATSPRSVRGDEHLSNLENRKALWAFMKVMIFSETIMGNPEFSTPNMRAIISRDTYKPHLIASAFEVAIQAAGESIKFNEQFNEHYLYLGSGHPLVLEKITPAMSDFLSRHTECKYELVHMLNEPTCTLLIIFKCSRNPQSDSLSPQNLRLIAMPTAIQYEKNSRTVHNITDKVQQDVWIGAREQKQILKLKPSGLEFLMQGIWHPIQKTTDVIHILKGQYGLDELNLTPEAQSEIPVQRNSRSPTPTRKVSVPASSMPRQVSDPSQVSGPVFPMPRQVSDSSQVSGAAFPMSRQTSGSVTPPRSSGSATPPLAQLVQSTTPPTTPRKGMFGRLMSASPRRSSSRANEQHGQLVVNHECLASFGGDAIGAESIDGDES